MRKHAKIHNHQTREITEISDDIGDILCDNLDKSSVTNLGISSAISHTLTSNPLLSSAVITAPAYDTPCALNLSFSACMSSAIDLDDEACKTCAVQDTPLDLSTSPIASAQHDMSAHDHVKWDFPMV